MYKQQRLHGPILGSGRNCQGWGRAGVSCAAAVVVGAVVVVAVVIGALQLYLQLLVQQQPAVAAATAAGCGGDQAVLSAPVDVHHNRLPVCAVSVWFIQF